VYVFNIVRATVAHTEQQSESINYQKDIFQCWVDYVLNTICYNYMILVSKSNLLLLDVTVKKK